MPLGALYLIYHHVHLKTGHPGHLKDFINIWFVQTHSNIDGSVLSAQFRQFLNLQVHLHLFASPSCWTCQSDAEWPINGGRFDTAMCCTSNEWSSGTRPPSHFFLQLIWAVIPATFHHLRPNCFIPFSLRERCSLFPFTPWTVWELRNSPFLLTQTRFCPNRCRSVGAVHYTPWPSETSYFMVPSIPSISSATPDVNPEDCCCNYLGVFLVCKLWKCGKC